MDFLINLGSSLLSFAHSIFSPGFCPGDWVWATIAAGAVIGLLPVLGAVLVALVRKGTGNTYNAATITVFAVAGGFFVFLMPWLFSVGMSEVFHNVFRGEPSGLSAAEANSVQRGYCGWVGPQDDFLGGRSTVYEVLFHPREGTVFLLVRVGLLVGLPALGLLFVWLQSRAAMRRGPKWPGRLLWIPFVLMVLLTAPMTANVAGTMWLGFVPMSVLGMLPVLVVGPPSWSVIERSNQKPLPYDPRAQQQRSQQHPPPYQPPPPLPPYQPPHQHQPARIPPPTRVAAPPEPEPDRAALAKLAADPGPLPFGGPAGPVGPPKAPTGLWQNSGGRFQKVKQLGQGGFGTVWLAKDTQLDRTVAVKLA
ncbi:MAG TPA: serine/threonine protein kinase, partial [Actinophytocola sp.]|nr:serine/threonine protein kinase [Actinophytocola sp.]